MGEFLKGWRRKAGLVTLAMACVLMVGWMRSYVVADWMTVPQQPAGALMLASAQGQLGCVYHTELALRETIGLDSADIPASPQFNVMNDALAIEGTTSEIKFVGFRFGAGRIPWLMMLGVVVEADHFEFWIIPYWSLVLPLTLLSAWLILGKPRAKPTR